MTSEEVAPAPASLCKELQQLHQKNPFEARGAVKKRAVTGTFLCGKYSTVREVSYYRMQEPLTTFCTCEKCG
jgi:transcription elongation factor S-II